MWCLVPTCFLPWAQTGETEGTARVEESVDGVVQLIFWFFKEVFLLCVSFIHQFFF